MIVLIFVAALALIGSLFFMTAEAFIEERRAQQEWLEAHRQYLAARLEMEKQNRKEFNEWIKHC